MHPRNLAEGFDLAREKVIACLDQAFIPMENLHTNRDMLVTVAMSSLATKLNRELASPLSQILTDAVLAIRTDEGAMDLHMVEVMHMAHRMSTETQLVRGLVLDHGARHSEMPKNLTDC